MNPEEKHKRCIVLKQEKAQTIDAIRDYDYYIVHAHSETAVYERREFLEKYRDFEKIIDLYCVKNSEELRYNNGNWVRRYESDEEQRQTATR